MKRTTIRFLYLGRDAATRKRLVDLLRGAGYTVTTQTRAAGDVPWNASDLVIGTPREMQPSASKHPGRTVVVTAEAPAPESPGSRRKPAKGPAMNLQQLREHVRQTQGAVARRAAVSQPQLSRVEGRRDHLVSTLRKYVRALGGDVQVVAEIGTERIVLRDV
ncbi:MAG TPA: helix-turn-helix transcriptional regulator [Polyangia bacterium]|nr:helix-turn-helix transcriptional regulator [Polyangia bacterium]